MCIDVPLFSANLDKIVSGGWLPLTLGLVMFTIMTTEERAFPPAASDA